MDLFWSFKTLSCELLLTPTAKKNQKHVCNAFILPSASGKTSSKCWRKRNLASSICTTGRRLQSRMSWPCRPMMSAWRRVARLLPRPTSSWQGSRGSWVFERRRWHRDLLPIWPASGLWFLKIITFSCAVNSFTRACNSKHSLTRFTRAFFGTQ